MKKMIQAVAIVLLMASCQKEIEFQDSNSTTIPGTTNGTNTTGSDYQPTTADSKWNMVSTSLGNYTMTSLGTDTTIGGLKYFKFNHSVGGRQYISKVNGVYKTYAVFPQTGGWVTNTYLKDAAVGTTWNDVLSASGANALMEYKVINTGGQRTVNGKQYNNVIKITYRQSVAGMTTAVGEQYYAKGVGPIEAVSRMDMLGMQMTIDSTYLESSIIK